MAQFLPIDVGATLDKELCDLVDAVDHFFDTGDCGSHFNLDDANANHSKA